MTNVEGDHESSLEISSDVTHTEIQYLEIPNVPPLAIKQPISKLNALSGSSRSSEGSI